MHGGTDAADELVWQNDACRRLHVRRKHNSSRMRTNLKKRKKEKRKK
jgi:hypothetical protein